jgi:ArsR family transcriptional regulator, arsenate/arsenite/antimonite-responsive transcriptional repressor
MNMMSRTQVEPELVGRLERLSEEEGCCRPEYTAIARSVRGSKAFPQALARAKALADPNRLLAASLLRRRGELCACEIQAATGLSHATVSHHMRVLAGAELVSTRRQGKWLYYRWAGSAGVELP